ncbi:hypothetical protein RND81_04G175000 [Saponaria officinalis]|uniref:25S rRNA (uridine-N(3))-methyltransferase BMT5-like domain-containing protein n=1 Tax=Saponaria officinalis TaxID=3572 RepID=A0AAW1LN85_SAPOF
MNSDLLSRFRNNLKIKEDDDNEKCIKHYRSNQKILLVGEGDFSFAVCLANAFGNASNLVATSLDSEGVLMQKYAKAERNVEVLKEKACIIVHEVDAHTMSNHAILKNQCFDRIIFNFPHSGLVRVYREEDSYQIALHQELVKGFLESAKKLISYEGEIHITHKTAYPFRRWNITELAEAAGLVLKEEVDFSKLDYPGYCNKKGEGHGLKCDKTFPVGACSTYMFGIL